jgi:hypothetical protein
MALYVGSQRYKILLGGNIELLTSDGFILMDLNGASLNAGYGGKYKIQLPSLNYEAIQDLNEKEDE